MSGISDGSLNFDTKIDNSGFKEDLKELVSVAEKGLKELKGALDTINDNIGSLASSVQEASKSFGNGMQETKKSLSSMSKEASSAKESTKGLESGIKALDKETSETGDAINEMTESISESGKEVKSWSGLIATAKSGLSGLGEAAKKTAEVTAKVVASAGAALGAVGAYATKVGSDFESSMSQVAATMGMSVEEINSGSEAFRMLQEAAKEAGATTQFSASESAQALNYLALAGYDAAQSCQALPAVLDLAAAGGLDLAYASDLVTDSMSALGLGLDDMGSFSDKLAKASQKSNTSVAQLGEAILTVGGTAKTLAGGTTELNASLGILADAGIKGAEGGTLLRNTILSLTAPTDTAAAVMKSLGLEVLDASGNMRPINSIMKDLDKSLEGLGEGDKQRILSELFNKTDLKGISALLANSGQRFDELSGYIDNADGACASMAKTMNDNLKGRLKELGSACENFGIEVYAGIETPLKEAAEKGIESVRNLTEAFTSDGFSGLVDQLAQEAYSWIEYLTEGITRALPKVLDLAKQIILELCHGLEANCTEIVNTASELIGYLINAIVEVAPHVADAALSLLEALGQGIASSLPTLLPAAIDTLMGFTGYVLDNIDMIIDLALQIIQSLADGLINAIPVLVDSAPTIIQKLVDALVDNLPKIIKFAAELIAQLALGILKNLPKISDAAAKIIETLVEGLFDYQEALNNATNDLVQEAINTLKEVDWAGVGSWIVDQVITGLGNPNFVGLKIGEKIGEKIREAFGGKSNALDYSGGTHKSSGGGTFGGGEASFGVKSKKDAISAFAPKLFMDDISKYKKQAEEDVKEVSDAIVKATGEAAKEQVKATRSADEILAAAKKSTSKKKEKEKEIIDGSARYAALLEQAELNRSSEYLEMQSKIADQEAKALEESLKAKEQTGIRSIQEAYNAYMRTEKDKVTEKEKAVKSLEDKLDKQNKALKIAQDTKDLKGAYKVLKALEIELAEDLTDEVKTQKLKDLETYAKEVKQEEINALEESNSARIETLKQGLEDEKSLMETYQDNYTKVFDGMVSAYDTAYKEISNKQDSLADKFKNFGDMFEKFKVDDVEYMKLGDLEGDIKQLQLLNAGVEALRAKGASQTYIDAMLTSNSVEDSLDFIELLNTESQASLDRHLAAWEEKQKLSEQIAGNIYKSEYETLKNDFTDQVATELGLMPEQAKVIGADTAKGLANGMLSKISDVQSAASALVAKMQEAVQAEMSSVGSKLSATSSVTQTVQTKDSSVNGLLGAILGALTQEQESRAEITIDGKKVGESTSVVNGVIREIKRRGVDLSVT